jgi:hypothetical protein
VLRIGQLRFAWSPPEWVVAISLCLSAGCYPPPHGILKAGKWLFTAIIAAVRQKFHLSSCPNFRDRLFFLVSHNGGSYGSIGAWNMQLWGSHDLHHAAFGRAGTIIAVNWRKNLVTMSS